MSVTLNRRVFSAGSIATMLGGSAVFSLPSMRTAVAQSPPDLSSLGLPTLDITASSNGYDGLPAETAAGRYLVTVTSNEALEFGAAEFMQPPAGHTVDEVLDLLASAGPPPDATPTGDGDEMGGAPPTLYYQMKIAGGAGSPGGASGQGVIDLGPGEWIVTAGDPELALPTATFTVTGEMPANLPEPEADINVTFIDFGISLDGDLTAGDHLLRLENKGAQPHFLYVLKGPDGLTNDDVAEILAFQMAGPSATPPDLPYDPDKDFTDVMSTAEQSIGVVQWVPASFDAGTYVAMCFVPTAGTGVPHAMNGMHTVFTVTA